MNESMFFLRCRIILAREFNIPPDNLLLEPIIECVKRGIREKCDSSVDELILTPRTKEEEKMIIFDHYGRTILNKLLSEKYPFYDWVQRFENQYVEEEIKKRNNW